MRGQNIKVPLPQCKHRHLYRLEARNIRLGVFNQEDRSFYGIRFKWGNRFIDAEEHWDCGEPFGTAEPLEELPEVLPETIELSMSREPNALFDWVESMLSKYPGSPEAL